jgi:opacity protein-like surface antigen
MKRALVCLGTLLLLSACSAAQGRSRLEIFGGYSLEHISACGAPGDTFLTCSGFIETGNSTPENYNGWDGAVTTFVYKFLGATADLSGHYGTSTIRQTSSASTSRLSYMFGPVAALRGHSFGPFVHGLFGQVHNKFGTFVTGEDTANVPTYTKFAWAVGGGVDINASRRLALRLAQFDYERVNVPNSFNPPYSAVAGFRFAAGIVFRP